MNDFRNRSWQRRGPSDKGPSGGSAPPNSGGTPRQAMRDASAASTSDVPAQGPYNDDGPQRLDDAARPAYTPVRPRKPTQHRMSSSSKRKIRRLRLLAVLFATGMVVSIVAAVVLYFHTQKLRGGELRVSAESRQLEMELAKARERITELNNDLTILLANRIPGIDSLIFNRQIELNKQYVKNITFVKSGLDGKTTIEFSAVLHNARTGPILPQVDIVLFDENGLQTGSARLDKSQTVTPVDIAELQPGETRTYSAQIALQRQTPSKYFVVEVR
jgi:hypothetical protein